MHVQAFADMTWENFVAKYVGRNASFRKQVDAARANLMGEGANDIQIPSAVSSTEEQGVETYMDYGLLTETEFSNLLDMSPNAVPLKRAEWKNESGMQVTGYLVSLLSCPPHIVPGICKVRFFFKTTIVLSELLLRPEKQISQRQGRSIFDFAMEKAAKKLPERLQHSKRLRCRTWGALHEKSVQIAAEREAEEKDDDEPGSQPDNSEATELMAMVAQGRGPVPKPRVNLGSLDDGLDDDDVPEPKAKKQKGLGKKDLDGASSVGKNSDVKLGRYTKVAESVEESENMKAIQSQDPELENVWRAYVNLTRVEPMTLLNMQPAKFLAKDPSVNGRTVDAATWY